MDQTSAAVLQIRPISRPDTSSTADGQRTSHRRDQIPSNLVLFARLQHPGSRSKSVARVANVPSRVCDAHDSHTLRPAGQLWTTSDVQTSNTSVIGFFTSQTRQAARRELFRRVTLRILLTRVLRFTEAYPCPILRISVLSSSHSASGSC
jgi:hypothetical protein